MTFKIDTVPPTLSVTSPVDGFVTNQAACNVQGTTNDLTSSPVSVTVKLNNGNAEAATVASNGSWSKVVTLVEGSNTITIVATEIKAVTMTPNPVDAGKTFVISVEVTD